MNKIPVAPYRDINEAVAANADKEKSLGHMVVKSIIRTNIPLVDNAKGETLGTLIDNALVQMRLDGAEVLSVTVTLPQEEN